jgi:hypothetical protein
MDRGVASGYTVRLNTGDGISAGQGCTITGCSAVTNTAVGIRSSDGSEVSRCAARDNGNKGIKVGGGCTVNDCTTQSNSFSGISVADGSTVRNCTTSWNKGAGILSGSRCQILENNCSLNGTGGGTASGINLNGNYNRVEGNNVVSNLYAGVFSSVIAGGILHHYCPVKIFLTPISAR